MAKAIGLIAGNGAFPILLAQEAKRRGTTAAAAKKLGRKWIGFEINEETAKIASQRIGE